MCKLDKKNDGRRMDPCMTYLIRFIEATKTYKPIACCCGHFKYPMTIVVTNGNINWDLISNIIIRRKKRFYKKDKQGYYYIPEVVNSVLDYNVVAR